MRQLIHGPIKPSRAFVSSIHARVLMREGGEELRGIDLAANTVWRSLNRRPSGHAIRDERDFD